MEKIRPVSVRAGSRKSWLSLFVGALVLLLASVGWAQVEGAISGNVKDSSGAVVSGATVTITNMETGAIRTTTTDNSGSYSVLSLPVGVYELRVNKSGFEEALWSGIRLNVGENRVENIELAVNPAVQEVTVTASSAQPPVVNTTTSQVSGLVSEKEITEIPLNGRGYDQLITLNPGTVDFKSLRFKNTTTSNGNAFSVDGLRPGDNLFLLNGVELTGASQLQVTPGGVGGNLLGVDAVREFNMLDGTYGAEYGKRAGAQVVVVTRSGSNQLHGTVYEFLRNSALDARNYFDQGPIPPFKQNQFGASMGGPLKKDRIFLFGNYEGFRQRLSTSSVSFGPDAAAAANTIPAMQKYLAMWPTPNPALGDVDLGGGVEKFFRHPKQSIDEDFGTARLDYIIGPQDTLSGAYTIDKGNSLLPLSDPLFASSLSVSSHTFSLEETHVFSPLIVNSATFGFSRAAFSNDSSPYVTLDPSVDLVLGRGPGSISIGGGLTVTGGGSITGAGPNQASGVYNHRNLFTYSDNLQIIKGRHHISLGVWLQPLQDNEDTASRQLGFASFSSLTAFEQGTLSTFQVVPTATELGWRSFLGAWYIEDNIKVRRNLMVSVGLRHEFDNGWNEVHGRASQFLIDPTTGSLGTGFTLGHSAFTQNNAKKLFGPRVGVAWDVFGNGSTAVHAGFGIYYSMLDALAFQLNSNWPYNGSIAKFGNLTNIAPYDPSTFNPFAPSALPCGTGNPAPCTKYAPQGVQQNAKIPTVEKWDLSIEQRLSNTISLRIAYVGSFAFHQLINVDPNTVVPAICPPGTTCKAGGVQTSGQPVTSPATIIGGPGGTTYIPWSSTPCSAVGQVGCRSNPGFSGAFYWLSQGNASYNALQIDVTKRFSRNLQFRANYTWSKDLDINSAPTGAQANNQAQMVLDRFNLRKDWGPSALNVTNSAHFTISYLLPFGRGQRFDSNVTGVADKLISGWRFNTITTLMSGFPITPQVGSNISGTGDTRNPDRPSLNPNFTGSIITGSASQWFNPNAFVEPQAGTFGNVGRGSLTGPGLAEVDVSLLKDTHLTDRVNLEFRAECFNVVNHPNFGTPTLTVFSGGAISPTAGQITYTATSSRQIQFGLKVIY